MNALATTRGLLDRNLPTLAAVERQTIESCLRRGMDRAGFPMTPEQRRRMEAQLRVLGGKP